MIKKIICKARQHLLLAISCVLVISLAGCVGISESQHENQPVYEAIFDAGSSGTRLVVYKVIPAPGGYPKITALGAQEYDDNGINDFLNDQGTITLIKNGKNVLPDGARPVNCTGGKKEITKTSAGLDVVIKDLGQTDVSPCVLEPLLLSLDPRLSANHLKRSNVNIQLFATAGMRTEDSNNGGAWTAEQIKRYYDLMKKYVANLGFVTGEFKTINGNSEEGVWTWVNFNDYYFNSFGGNPIVSKNVQAPVGDFEVGGSSMQVAFPTDSGPSDADNVYAVSINGYSFNVFSKTFLGLGGDDARKFVKAISYPNNNGAKSCYAKTATPFNTAEESDIQLYPSNQVSGISSFTYPFHGNLGNAITPWTRVPNVSTKGVKGSLLLRGAPEFNFNECSSSFTTVIDQVTTLDRNNYGTFQDGDRVTMNSFKEKLRSSRAPFIGIDNFFRTANYLDYKPSEGFSPSRFLSKLEEYCAGKVVDDRYMQNVCPNGVFMYTYLFGPAGLFTGNTAQFAGVMDPKNAAGEGVLTWTRGYLLMKYSN